MKRILIIFILLITNSVFAGVSENSAKLEKLRLIAIENPSEKNELAYLEAFPDTFDKFYFTFYGKKCCEELYDTHMEHINLLQSLSIKYPEKVLDIWLNVSTNGHWDADAVGFLQDQLAHYAANNTENFAKALNRRSPNDRTSIIRFLADVENHLSYDDYRITSENLNKLGFKNLHTEFEKEKSRRMQIDDH
jgi:hypothetical protein